MKRFIFGTACAALMAPTLAFGQTSSNRVGEETDWSYFSEQSPKECWAVSAPKETVNTRGGQVVDARRGEIQLMVFFRPSESANPQVAFTGGYPFAPGRLIKMDIDGTTFDMTTQGEWAWPISASQDAQFISAMRKGSKATVTALSSRGTTTKDEFSLLGFTAAVNKAQDLCK